MNKSRILFFSITVFFFCSCATQKVDILVIGGGASGTTAGIQSARLGARTLIVEEFDWLGGMLTSAGVSAIDGNNKLPGGLWGEFRDSLVLRYGGIEKLKTGWVSNTLFEPSVGSKVLVNMCRKEKKLNVWMHTKFISAENDRTGWIVKLRQGNHTSQIKTNILIDATELGDVAKACGVKYDVGMDSRAESNESIAPESANNIVQDLTYVMILKDYGPYADKTIEKPKNYDPSHFYCACKTEKCTNLKGEHHLWDCTRMITYGKLPNNKYMINWPIEGNDFCLNVIEMSDKERTQALQKAKDFSLSFLYYIQHDLGYKNLGLADDEYPTSDKLPFIPYYRESRRIHGLVRFNINHVTRPYDQPEKLYRTGVAVGDYPIDHHHTRYPQGYELPDLHFPPIPSYSLPLGTLIPQNVDNLIVAEKSISVSNIINGTTRLQPVVLQIGQASGALAALAVSEKKKVSEVPVRDVQNVILNSNGYLMPFLDLDLSDRYFKALQRIGSTGILRGEGKSMDWSNQTWFNADSLVSINELKTGLHEFCGMNIGNSNDILSIEKTITLINDLANQFNLHKYTVNEFKVKWNELGLNSFNKKKNISRKEFAVMLDALIDPFNLKAVNIKGEFF